MTEEEKKTLEEAAARGEADAQYKLAGLYFSGNDGYARDLDKAEQYYKLAIEQGHVKAMSDMGVLCKQRNQIDAAMEWWDKAAEHNSGQAVANMAECYFFGDGVAQDKKEARKMLDDALASGCSEKGCVMSARLTYKFWFIFEHWLFSLILFVAVLAAMFWWNWIAGTATLLTIVILLLILFYKIGSADNENQQQ